MKTIHECILPFGTTHVTVEQAPEYLARAIYPDDPDTVESLGRSVQRHYALTSEWPKSLRQAIEAGIIRTHSPSGVAYEAIANTMALARISIDDFSKWAEGLLVKVTVAQSPNDHTDIAQIAFQAAQNRSAGRYTLEQAAALLATDGGESFKPMLQKLTAAARSGRLSMHNPGENARRDYGATDSSVLRIFHEEAFWDDLNAWLSEFESRVTYRFPNPSPEAIDAEIDRKQLETKQQQWNQRFIKALDELTLDPKALPKKKIGHRGPRSAVSRILDVKIHEKKSFENAWDKAIADKVIVFIK